MKVRIQNALFSEHRIITWLPLLLLLLLAGPAELDAQSFGVYSVNYWTQDLLYDPVRDRLLLSVMNDASLGQSNGLAVFNPYTGLTESFISMTAAPGRMARADDGHFLYVSKPDAGTVQQFNLPTLTTSYSFPIGGEQIYGIQYTNYAANLAVVPGQPNAVVAWTVRHVNAGAMEYGEGIALYENGVMASICRTRRRCHNVQRFVGGAIRHQFRHCFAITTAIFGTAHLIRTGSALPNNVRCLLRWC